MQENYELLKHKKIKEIILPGSHDSGTYSIRRSIIKSLYETQVLNIYEQLSHGARFFDIRLRTFSNNIRIFHGDGSGPKCRDVLEQFNRFLIETNHELVIMRLKFKNAKDRQVVISKIITMMSPFLISRAEIGFSMDKHSDFNINHVTDKLKDYFYEDLFYNGNTKSRLLLLLHHKDGKEECESEQIMNESIFLFCYHKFYDGKYSERRDMTKAYNKQMDQLTEYLKANPDLLYKSRGNKLNNLFSLWLTITYVTVINNTSKLKFTSNGKKYDIICTVCKFGFIGHLFVVDIFGGDVWYNNYSYKFDSDTNRYIYSYSETKSHDSLMDIVIQLNILYNEIYFANEFDESKKFEQINHYFDCKNEILKCNI